MKKNLRPQLSDSNPTTPLGKPVPIFPHGIPKLRTPHDDLAQGNTALGLNWLNLSVDPCIEAKDKRSVVAVQDEVATRDEDLAGSRDSLGLKGEIGGHR